MIDGQLSFSRRNAVQLVLLTDCRWFGPVTASIFCSFSKIGWSRPRDAAAGCEKRRHRLRGDAHNLDSHLGAIRISREANSERPMPRSPGKSPARSASCRSRQVAPRRSGATSKSATGAMREKMRTACPLGSSRSALHSRPTFRGLLPGWSDAPRSHQRLLPAEVGLQAECHCLPAH
jgi:hypothetical protein